MAAERRKLTALIMATIGAPVISCAILGAVVALGWLIFELRASTLSPLPLIVGASAFFYAIVFAVPVTIIFGSLVHHVFQARRIVNASAYVYAGIACATTCAALIASLMFVWPRTAFPDAWRPLFGALSYATVVFGIPIGWLTGYIGWLFRRPDHDQAAPS